MKFLLLCLVAATAFAQAKLEGDPNPQPKVTNAKVETISAAAGLKPTFDAAVKRAGAHWIGYAVASSARSRLICCFDNLRAFQQRGSACCLGCRLEHSDSNFMNSDGGTCVNPEPLRAVFVLFRAQAGKVERIRTFTPDCGLDVGGLPLLWLEQVDPRQSVALLEGFTRDGAPAAKKASSPGDDEDDDDDDESSGGYRLAEGALQAIALHKDPEALRVLERLLAPGQPLKVRKQAAFWAGNERGREGFELLKGIVPSDPDPRFRREGTFALAQSSEEKEAVQLLIHMAHQDRDADVREQAVFWLAQKASHEAAQAVTDAVENDPESSVRKKAVFALSQMPAEQGVPLLIRYAQSHKDPVVRKEAIFWLGQSGDPRALDFIEKILLSKK